jgi:hypothetical protein
MFGHAGMTLNEMCALDVAAHSGLEGLATAPAIQFKLSEQENKVLSNISSFVGVVTAAKAAGAKPQPKPTAALRIMTMENDMCFWGPNGMISKFLASVRTTVTDLGGASPRRQRRRPDPGPGPAAPPCGGACGTARGACARYKRCRNSVPRANTTVGRTRSRSSHGPETYRVVGASTLCRECCVRLSVADISSQTEQQTEIYEQRRVQSSKK